MLLVERTGEGNNETAPGGQIPSLQLQDPSNHTLRRLENPSIHYVSSEDPRTTQRRAAQIKTPSICNASFCTTGWIEVVTKCTDRDRRSAQSLASIRLPTNPTNSTNSSSSFVHGRKQSSLQKLCCKYAWWETDRVLNFSIQHFPIHCWIESSSYFRP